MTEDEVKRERVAPGVPGSLRIPEVLEARSHHIRSAVRRGRSDPATAASSSPRRSSAAVVEERQQAAHPTGRVVAQGDRRTQGCSYLQIGVARWT